MCVAAIMSKSLRWWWHKARGGKRRRRRSGENCVARNGCSRAATLMYGHVQKAAAAYRTTHIILLNILLYATIYHSLISENIIFTGAGERIGTLGKMFKTHYNDGSECFESHVDRVYVSSYRKTRSI